MIAEPTKVRASTTVYWERDLPNFLNTTWTATYTLNAAGLAQITFNASAGSTTQEHVVNVSAATTTNWAAGTYAWYLTVTDGTSIFEIDQGTIEILSATATGNDLLDAKANLAAAEAELVARTSGKANSYSIKDRSLTRMSESELLNAIKYWRAKVQTLTEQERIRKGGKSKRLIYSRFR